MIKIGLMISWNLKGMCHRINNKFSIDMRHLFTFQKFSINWIGIPIELLILRLCLWSWLSLFLMQNCVLNSTKKKNGAIRNQSAQYWRNNWKRRNKFRRNWKSMIAPAQFSKNGAITSAIIFGAIMSPYTLFSNQKYHIAIYF